MVDLGSCKEFAICILVVGERMFQSICLEEIKRHNSFECLRKWFELDI